LAAAALVQVFGSWVRIHVGPPNSFVASGARAIKAEFTAALAVRHADSQRLTGALAPFLSPRPESEKDGIEFPSHTRQKVLVPHGEPAVDAPLDQPVRLKTLEPRGKHLRSGARLGLKVIEAQAAHEQLPHNEDRPSVPNNRC
jgi:hypothetical protein